MESFAVFAVASAAIALVFVSWALFKMTRFPPGPLLVVLGLSLSLLGSTVPDAVQSAVKLVSPILLGAVLFGCGLRINLKICANSPISIVGSFVVFSITLVVVGIASTVLLGIGVAEAVVVGALFGAVSSFFTGRSVEMLNLDSKIKDSVVISSSIIETLAVLVIIGVFSLKQGIPIIEMLAFGSCFGLLIGIVWVRLVRYASDFPYKDFLSVSLGLGLIAFCEMIFAHSGLVSALFFGVAMGNGALLKTKITITSLNKLYEDVLMFGGTFLFFYLGLRVLSILDMGIIYAGVVLWGISFVIGFLVNYFVFRNGVLAGIMPRDLSVVLVSQIALGFWAVGSLLFVLSVPLVILSGIGAGISSLLIEGKKPGEPDVVTYIEHPQKRSIKHAYDIDEVKKTIEK